MQEDWILTFNFSNMLASPWNKAKAAGLKRPPSSQRLWASLFLCGHHCVVRAFTAPLFAYDHELQMLHQDIYTKACKMYFRKHFSITGQDWDEKEMLAVSPSCTRRNVRRGWALGGEGKAERKQRESRNRCRQFVKRKGRDISSKCVFREQRSTVRK